MKPVPADMEARFAGLRRLIGNTPLLAIDYAFRGRRRRLYAKAEHQNMTGSVKDRMALHVLLRAYETEAIQPGALIVEATSGNTGISFSAVGRALGHPVAIFMPDWMSVERVALMRAYGAAVHPVSNDNGGFTGSVGKAEELAELSPGAFLPRQFSNPDNVGAHYEATGPEIHWQLGTEGLSPDAFVAGVGTGGTVMGAGRYLTEHHPGVRVHPLEPSNAPMLSARHLAGRHRIRGIGDAFVPPIVDLSELDHVVGVDDGDAILMAQKLARELGLGVGISSGANFLGAVLVHDLLGSDAVVVTIFPDGNAKYLSSELLHEEPVRREHLAPWVELRGFTALNRTCQMCDTSGDLVRMAGGVAAT